MDFGIDGYNDAAFDEICNKARELEAARDLLAVIHRDGGQHKDAVGAEQSCADARAAVLAMREVLDGKDARIAELEAALAAAESEAGNE